MISLIGAAVIAASLLLYVWQALRFNLGGMIAAAVIGFIGAGVFIGGLLP